MTKRIAAAVKTRERLRALIDGRLGTEADRSELARLAVQLIVEEVLEGEARDKLGRERYERAKGEASGYRNGYRRRPEENGGGDGGVVSTAIARYGEPFVSAVRENLAGRTEALEDLAVELFARGLSTRDIEAAFTDADGRRLVSRAAVSEITERLWEEYEAFTYRDLSESDIVYLFIDGIAERLRAGCPREPVIAAWGSVRKWLEGLAASHERLEGGHRDGTRVLPGHARSRARRSDPGDQRRCSGHHPVD